MPLRANIHSHTKLRILALSLPEAATELFIRHRPVVLRSSPFVCQLSFANNAKQARGPVYPGQEPLFLSLWLLQLVHQKAEEANSCDAVCRRKKSVTDYV